MVGPIGRRRQRTQGQHLSIATRQGRPRQTPFPAEKETAPASRRTAEAEASNLATISPEGGAAPSEKGCAGLLQRSIDVGKLGIDVGAKAVDDSDDRERNAGGDQAVFNSGSARFV